jgi:thioredoxin reductase
MHGFLTRDGVRPEDFRRIAHEQLDRYDSVAFHRCEVSAATRLPNGCFELKLSAKHRVRCRKVLIATGVFDRLPSIGGIDRLFGTAVFQCPYCDGWEVRDMPIAVYGKRQRGFDMARAMTAWTRDIALCTDGPSGLSAAAKDRLRRNDIKLFEDRIAALEGSGGELKAVVFRNGERLARSALFFDTPCSAQSQLADSLGCQFMKHGGIKCGQYEATSVPGVFVAGNIIKDVQLAVVAAAEGTRAAFGINRTLTREDFDRRVTGSRRVQHPSQDAAMDRRRFKDGT